MVAVAVYMIASYGMFGVFANIALAVNIAAAGGGPVQHRRHADLPGIAGIVLTMGMAVDANVLIYERIREELRDGKSPARAVELGLNARSRPSWTPTSPAFSPRSSCSSSGRARCGALR
jgi:preprotein translocase subunit SecD